MIEPLSRSKARYTSCCISGSPQATPHHVDCFSKGSGDGCLLDGLRQRRVAVAGPCEVLGARAILHGDAALVYHLAGVGAHDVHTEQLIRLERSGDGCGIKSEG